MPSETEGFGPEPDRPTLRQWEGQPITTYEAAGSPDSAGEADSLPWPPWLESLSVPERIRAIVAAVDACAAGHGAPARPHGASEQHCTTSMAEHFLAKMLVPDPAGDRTALRDRINAALQDSIDRCARCKACDNQVDAVLAVVAPLFPAGDQVSVSREDLRRAVPRYDEDQLADLPPALRESLARLRAAAGDPR